jgi:hypothetical protein
MFQLVTRTPFANGLKQGQEYLAALRELNQASLEFINDATNPKNQNSFVTTTITLGRNFIATMTTMKHLRKSEMRYVKKNLSLNFGYENIDFE